MSAIFDLLKKLDQKKQSNPSNTSDAPRDFSSSGQNGKPFQPAVIWRAVFFVVFFGFVIVAFFKFHVLNAALSSYQADLTSRLDSLTGRLEELAKGIQTLAAEGQNTDKRFERLAGDFAQERDLRIGLGEKQAQLMESHRNAIQAQLEERFGLLSRQIAYLKEKFQKS